MISPCFFSYTDGLLRTCDLTWNQQVLHQFLTGRRLVSEHQIVFVFPTQDLQSYFDISEKAKRHAVV